MDVGVDRCTDGWVGLEGLGGATWGCKATGSLRRIGGPLEWGRRDLENVESHRCNWAAIKTHLGVPRRSYRPGYSPKAARKHFAQARRVQMYMVTIGWMVTCTPLGSRRFRWVRSASRSLLGWAR